MFGSSNEIKSMESKVCSEIGCIKIHWNHVLLNKSANFKAFFLIFQVRLDENITMTTTFAGAKKISLRLYICSQLHRNVQAKL